MNQESISFVREHSIKPKFIGHNKYQIQLEELNEKFKISEDNLLNSENLNQTLQESIIFLKSQNNTLQESNLSLNNDLITVNKELNTLKKKYTDLEESTKICIIDMENVNKTIFQENLSLTNTISNILLEKDSFNTKYNDIKSQYQTLLSNFIIKSEQNINLTNTLNDTTTTCSLYKDTNLQLQTELDSINLQIDKLQKEILDKNTQLQEKDNIIGLLHFKYSKEFNYVDISNEPKLQINQEINSQEFNSQENISQEINSQEINSTENLEPIKSIEKSFKGIKMSSNRGLKIFKR